MGIEHVSDTSCGQSTQSTQLGVTVYATQVIGVDALHRLVDPELPDEDVCFPAG